MGSTHQPADTHTQHHLLGYQTMVHRMAITVTRAPGMDGPSQRSCVSPTYTSLPLSFSNGDDLGSKKRQPAHVTPTAGAWSGCTPREDGQSVAASVRACEATPPPRETIGVTSWPTSRSYACIVARLHISKPTASLPVTGGPTSLPPPQNPKTQNP
jgi:hypothetical protein